MKAKDKEYEAVKIISTANYLTILREHSKVEEKLLGETSAQIKELVECFSNRVAQLQDGKPEHYVTAFLRAHLHFAKSPKLLPLTREEAKTLLFTGLEGNTIAEFVTPKFMERAAYLLYKISNKQYKGLSKKFLKRVEELGLK